MLTRKKRRLADNTPKASDTRGLDDCEDDSKTKQAVATVVVNKPAVELYQTLLATASKLCQLQDGHFGDGMAEESTTFLLQQLTPAGGFNLRLVGTRTKWQELPRAVAAAQQQLTSAIDKRKQDVLALEAKSASLCLRMEQSSEQEQKELSDELYCIRQMIGRHKAELQELLGRETLEVEAGVEREQCVVELSVLRNSWSSREKTRGLIRQACLYVFGGCCAGGADPYQRLGHTFCYDAKQNSWTRLGELHRPRAHPAGLAVGKYLYAMGGVDAGSRLRDVERLDISRQDARWERLPALAQACVGALALTLGNNIYLLGGSGDIHHLARVAVLDTTTKVWSESVPMSRARSYPGGGVLGGRLYVFGGRSDEDEPLACAESCSPGGSWSAVARLRVARWGCSAAVLNNRLYAIGGLNALDQVLTSVERYDPAMDVWEEVAPLRQGREDSAAAVLNGELYVLGGSSCEGKALASVERYDENHNVWQHVTDLPMKISRAACAVAG